MAEQKKGKRLDELKQMTDEELGNAAEAARRAIYQVRREHLSKNVKAIHGHRKEIARIMTLKRERELEAAGVKQ